MPFPSILRRKPSKESENASGTENSGPDRTEESRHRDPERVSPIKKHTGSLGSSLDSTVDAEVAELSDDDIKALFSGAPHFMLEAERDGRPRPHVRFPWDKELDIGDLLDEKMIGHDSFASCTLHAHLPIPGSDHTKRRPAFGVGVFEVPNMLAYQGKEPGTIGMRHFLEKPVSDSLVTEAQAREENIAARAREMSQIARMSTTEAFRTMQLGGMMNNVGKNVAWQDRDKFIRDQSSWKELGLRDITMDIINTRTAIIVPWYNEMSREGWRRTILDQVDSDTLYDELFTLLLCPLRKANPSLDRSLSVQIEALVNVLSTPGAWFDFSLVEWRFHFGEVLWEVPKPDEMNQRVDSGARRHWLLVQILLSIELAIRLDAVLRDPKVHHLDGHQLPELQRYQSLRNKKVDWDLVMARAFMDYVYVEDRPGIFPQTRPEIGKRAGSNIFLKWRQKLEPREGHKEHSKSAWDMLILARHADVQLEGLLSFGKAIGWPNMEAYEQRLRIKLERYVAATSAAKSDGWVHYLQRTVTLPQVTDAIVSRSSHPLPRRTTTPQASNTQLSRSSEVKKGTEESDLRVTLQPASERDAGGWLSRSWFNGLILPGESISHILISTILEQDPENLMRIGLDGKLCGGFVLNGQSWWSKACIVGKVMAAYKGTESMGWISTPQIQPMDQSRGALGNRWFKVKAQMCLDSGQEERVHSGRAVAEDSNPLGSGHGRGRVRCKDFLIARDESKAEKFEDFKFEALMLRSTDSDDSLLASVVFKTTPHSASSIEMDWELTHDVSFVSASACRMPSRYAILQSRQGTNCSRLQSVGSLDAHPLHKSFRYIVKNISDLLEGVAKIPGHASRKDGEVCIVDARGYSFLQVLARAWCSKVGQNAIVSRVGVTCLSCSIREARALAIGVVIRIGRRNGPVEGGN